MRRWTLYRGTHRLVGVVLNLVLLLGGLSAQAAELYVSSFNTDQVLRYDGTTGAFVDAFVAAGSGGLDGPFGLVFGPDGALYVSSFGTDQVLRYDGTTGAFVDAFVTANSGGLDNPTGLVFGPDGRLYVSSLSTDQVLRYDGTTGAFLGVFASGDGLLSPFGLVFGPDGRLYVSSASTDQVLRYDGTTGAFVDAFVTPPTNGGLMGPQGLVFGPDGRLYVSSLFTHQVLRYDGTTGAFVDAFVTMHSGGLDDPIGLVFGPDGHLYVSSNGTDQVLRYDGTTGAFVDDFVPANSGGLNGPTFLTFGPSPAAECPEDADKVLTRAVDPEGNDAALIGGLPTYTTLQAAVDAAQDGDVIGVYGRSTENVLIHAAKTLTITQCTVAELTAAAAGPVVDITSTEPITIIGLDTVGGTIGWRVGTDGHDLKGVRATGASQFGILVVGHDNSVSYNSVRSSAVGIRIEGSGNDLRGGTVEDNLGDGVQVGLSATDNTFRTATVQFNGGHGIVVAGSHNTIRDNSRVNRNTLNGLRVTGSDNSLRSNRADENTQDGFHISGQRNTLQDNKANKNRDDGFDISGTGNILKGNASNQGGAGGSNENRGAEYRVSTAAVNQGGNKADNVGVPKTTTPTKCPTFPAAGTICE